MSNKLYNMIMGSNPEFWSNSDQYVDFPKSRFLKHTVDDLEKQFQLLDQNAINRLKNLPTLFAVECENVDTRIGKITDIEVHRRILRIRYKFDEEHYPYPLTRGVLQQNWQRLGINKPRLEFYTTHWAIKECDISAFYKEYLKTLTGIAHQLKDSDKKVQLIYAFNGSGKTRLSREFKQLIVRKNNDTDAEEQAESSHTKILYYNAFTEDLFYWDNDLEQDAEPKLKIQPNSFTDWILKDQGQDRNIITNFQRYANQKLTPRFNEDFTEVTFSLESGDDKQSDNLKISKGEESNFIWSIFYSLLDQVVTILNVADLAERETDQFNELEYVFIDDPVSSLDENHLIELAVNMAGLIRSSESGLRFIITTHSPLFYNVLHKELNNKNCYLLERCEDGTSTLEEKSGDSNQSFSYHLHLKNIIEKAIADNKIEKFHFTLLRNLYEKTASFLGYAKWQDLLETAPGDKDAYFKRIITFSSHRTLSSEEVREPTEPEKQTVSLLLRNLIDNYGYWRKKEQQYG